MDLGEPADSIVDVIGNTPIIRMQRLTPENGNKIFCKVEARNPAGSVKDRIGHRMLRAAAETGDLREGMTIVESTSGNTGIALAMAAAALGYELILTMPESMSVERRSVMASYGAEIILTPAEEDMAGAMSRAEELRSSAPERFYMPEQFSNPANPLTHTETTAQEILESMELPLDALIAGVGTGGTITGVGQVLKEQMPGIRIIAVEPAASPVLSGGPPGLHGIQGIGAGFVPDVLDRTLIDEVCPVTDEEAFEYARRLTREEGLLVGPSSGANIAAALRVAEQIGPGRRLFTFLCDTGFRYLSVDGFVPS